MPFLKLITNSEIDASKKNQILAEISDLAAKHTHKPERYVMVHLLDKQTMSFGGDTAPLAYLECKSIGLDTAQVNALAQALNHYVSGALGVAGERIYIEFSNCPAELWAWNGATFG